VRQFGCRLYTSIGVIKPSGVMPTKVGIQCAAGLNAAVGGTCCAAVDPDLRRGDDWWNGVTGRWGDGVKNFYDLGPTVKPRDDNEGLRSGGPRPSTFAIRLHFVPARQEATADRGYKGTPSPAKGNYPNTEYRLFVAGWLYFFPLEIIFKF